MIEPVAFQDEAVSSQVHPTIMEVPPLNLPQELLHFMHRDEMKEPAKPADLLIPLTPLNEEHYTEAAQTERAGHGRPNQRDMSPITAAREATAKQAKQRSRRGRASDAEPKLPLHREIDMGWRDLLDEIATSSRRVLLARGGQTTILPQSEIVKETARAYLRTPSPDELLSFPDAEESRPRSRTRSNISPAPEECRPRSRTRSTMSPAPDEFKARSLRRSTISPGPEEGRARSRTRSNISAAPEDCRPRSRTRSNISPAPEEKPEETATVPPDHAQDDGLWLSYRITEEKVPTAVLTKLWSLAVDPRKDEDIPPMEHVPRLTVAKREVPLPTVHDIPQWRRTNLRRREQRKLRREAERNPTLDEMLTSIFGEPEMEKLLTAENHVYQYRAASLLAAVADEMSSPSAIQLLMDEFLDSLPGHQHLEPKLLGSLRRGRRGAFDEGQASAKLALSIAEQARLDKNVVRNKRLRRGAEHTRAWRSDLQCISTAEMLLLREKDDEARMKHMKEVDRREKAAEAHMKDVVKACTTACEKCQKRASRFHSAFVRRQGSLSDSLQRRVKRIQYDHTEIQQMKEQSILPSVIGQPQSESDKATHLSVLHYLKPHRVHVEKQRQEAHSIYMAQVDKIQHYQRILADPKREPDRGEVFLSRCFRYVLAAGLAVDDAYFFRVLSQMQPEDFEKVYTVNFLAACCDAFSISTRQYFQFLENSGLPCLVPMPQEGKALIYDDTAAWDQLCVAPAQLESESWATPLPLYPVFDMVLQRYNLGSKGKANLVSQLVSLASRRASEETQPSTMTLAKQATLSTLPSEKLPCEPSPEPAEEGKPFYFRNTQTRFFSTVMELDPK
ncbi:unnamed protein product [Symbiodinium necroappetens]|uniref:Uncharacterized protein n=1 Tax=Symbiodinium necroappetens TaxID=1628268 RepID=A0A813BFY0_9DINO|nr:unnamed protein product [Symbiodinium necroappetens]